MQYADDTIFVGKWEQSNGVNLICLLKCFEKASGLKINFKKSNLYGVGVLQSEVEDMARVLNCKPGKIPFIYLGLPVGGNMGRIDNWKPVVEKVRNKLTRWKAKVMSFGGRLTLVRSVLGSIPLYYFSLFRAPVSVSKTLERIRRNFFWGGRGDLENYKYGWVKWEDILKKYELGGLNIGSLRASN